MNFKSETIKAAYEKMENFFSKFATDPIVTTEQSFKEAKLIDGTTIIQYDGETPTQGIPVNVVTPEGILPMPDGEYQLEDGTVFTVSGGLIAEVKEAEPVAEGETNAPMATEGTQTTAQTGTMEVKPAPKRVIKSQVEEHVFHLDIEGYEPVKIDFSAIFKSLIEENKALKDLNKEMFNVIKEIAGEPSVVATENTKKVFSIKEQKAAFKADLQRLEKESQK